MFQHRTPAPRIPMHALAILAAALMACGTVSGAGGSAGRSATVGSDTPTDVRLTEFEYEGQTAAPRTVVPVDIRMDSSSSTSDALAVVERAAPFVSQPDLTSPFLTFAGVYAWLAATEARDTDAVRLWLDRLPREIPPVVGTVKVIAAALR